MADVGRLLHPEDRDSLLAAFPRAYPRVVARHIALECGEPPDFPLPGGAEGFVVGVADDGAGVQALVVEIGGSTRRPDGGAYHIAWSPGAPHGGGEQRRDPGTGLDGDARAPPRPAGARDAPVRGAARRRILGR